MEKKNVIERMFDGVKRQRQLRIRKLSTTIPYQLCKQMFFFHFCWCKGFFLFSSLRRLWWRDAGLLIKTHSKTMRRNNEGLFLLHRKLSKSQPHVITRHNNLMSFRVAMRSENSSFKWRMRNCNRFSHAGVEFASVCSMFQSHGETDFARRHFFHSQ